MYRNLSPRWLGLSGCRDHELIELALTYRFAGMELDLDRFQSQVRAKGMDAAKRYLASAPLKVSSAESPIDLAASDAEFRGSAQKLDELVASMTAMDCPLLTFRLMAGSNELPYHQNFEFHCQRLSEIAARLATNKIHIGLTFSAVPTDRAEFVHPFIQTTEALLALIKMTGSPHVVAVVDTWTWILGGGTIDQIARLGPDGIGDVWLADLPAGYNPHRITLEQRLMPGTSDVIDFPSLLSQLSHVGYTGPITPTPHRKALQAQSREDAVGRTAQQMDSLWQAAGLTPTQDDVHLPEAATTAG